MTSLLGTLAESLGTESVIPQEELPHYSVDGVAPSVALFPRDIDGVSRALSFASSEGMHVVPWGGGTQMTLGNSPHEVDVVLGISRLNRVLFHEPADLVVSVEAGITLRALQEELATKGQFLPLEAPIPSRATIGGILAANASGPSRLAYGTPRDWLIGVRVVHSDGAVTKSGGRVVKNVTGYDLNKLYVGSLGTLGVIVEAIFKIAPLTPETRTLVSTYSSLHSAVDSAKELLRQSYAPNALQVVDHEVVSRLPGLGSAMDSGAAVLALVAGRKSAVARKAGDMAKLIANSDAPAVECLPSRKAMLSGAR